MTNARRQPIQQRAQETVEALLEATAQLLVEDGYARLSTNRIARRAGVSVGSLYQYFADKDALVEALTRRVAERSAERIAQGLLGGVEQPLGELARSLIRGLVEAKRDEPELARAMAIEVPRQGRLDVEREVLGRLCGILSVVLRQRSDVRPVNAEMAAFMLVHGVFAVVRDAAAERPELLLGDELADELAELTLRYLS
ncbi:MAG: TetR/AcrR family transcriptional regulator [Myxococcota bacterium]